MEKESKSVIHKKICAHLAIVLCGILFLIFILPGLVKFFAPLVVAWIIAMMANPPVRFLENRIKIMRKHGSAIVIVFVIVAITVVLYAVVHALFTQVSSMVETLPDIYGNVLDNLQQFTLTLHEKYDIIPANIKKLVTNNESKINEYILSALDSLSTGSVSAVSSVASSVIDIFILSILTLMIAYFFTAGNDRIKAVIRKNMPESINKSIALIKNTVFIAIGGYLKACFQIMIVMFIILLVFFVAMKIEYAVPVALITAILDFLPFIGTGTVLIPWALYSAITGGYIKALFLIIAYLVTMLVRRLLEPKLVGDSIGMSPFFTLISMFIFYRLTGVSGLIIGIPVGMVIKEFYEKGFFNHTIEGIKILAGDINEYRKYWQYSKNGQ
ncbi:MAG: sporulation integral membrane protein YtvI [Lachnospiraceae bacterium]|nr:sporulation integral membrane protein YtvI [Lachnospiraceae bacterium]